MLRIICILCGEVVSLISPEIGLLHRGSEKLIECNYWSSSIPYFDRFDYVSTITQEHLFSYTVERMINSFIVMYVSSLRCLFMEYYRIMNHTLAITTHAIDIGIRKGEVTARAGQSLLQNIPYYNNHLFPLIICSRSVSLSSATIRHSYQSNKLYIKSNGKQKRGFDIASGAGGGAERGDTGSLK